MDPNANLQEQVELARAIIAQWDADQTIPDYHSARLAELVLALNGWITAGGFLPAVYAERAQAAAGWVQAAVQAEAFPAFLECGCAVGACDCHEHTHECPTCGYEWPCSDDEQRCDESCQNPAGCDERG